MASRFHLFEHLMLPSLKAQTDQDFEMVFTLSSTMPETYRARLEELLEGWAPARLNVTEATDIGRALRPLIKEASEDETRANIHFRLDDDDALAAIYLARLRSAADRMSPGSMISFSSGFVGFTDGTTAKHTTRTTPCIAIGLAQYHRPESWRSPFQIQHKQHINRVPTFVDPSFKAYHHSVHGTNNTKGYGRLMHADTRAESQWVRNLVNSHRELRDGATVPEGLDDKISAAFPFTTGTQIRAAMEQSLNGQQLAEEMGFSHLM